MYALPFGHHHPGGIGKQINDVRATAVEQKALTPAHRPGTAR